MRAARRTADARQLTFISPPAIKAAVAIGNEAARRHEAVAPPKSADDEGAECGRALAERVVVIVVGLSSNATLSGVCHSDAR